jgi:hypothetical protein
VVSGHAGRLVADMVTQLNKMSLESLRQMRTDILASQTAEDGKMTFGEYTAKFGEQRTQRAEKAAFLVQLDDAIGKLEVTGSEKIQ